MQITEGDRTKESACSNPQCNKNSGTFCPNQKCEAPLSAPHLRCPICHYHIEWEDHAPKKFDRKKHIATFGSLPDIAASHARELLLEAEQRGVRSNTRPSITVRAATRINKEVAAEFAKLDGTLSLPSVESFNDATPLFDRFRPNQRAYKLTSLYLDGILSERNICDETLATLEAMKCVVSLSGLNSISHELATSLAKRRYTTILNGLTDLTDQLADILGRARGRIILDSLPLTKCPSPLQARFWLVEFCDFYHVLKDIPHGPTLTRNLREKSKERRQRTFEYPVSELTPEQARELPSDNEEDILSLPELTDLKRPEASILGKHRGELQAGGLERLGGEELTELMKGPKKLAFDKLKKISSLDAFLEAAKQRLTAGTKIRLRTKSLGGMTASQAKRLACLPISIKTGSGEWLSPGVAEILANGEAEITVVNRETVASQITKLISSLNKSNLVIAKETELQRELKRLISTKELGKPLMPIQLTYPTFTEEDKEAVREAFGDLPDLVIRFPRRQEPEWTIEMADHISRCPCEFVFTKPGDKALDDAILRMLLLHAGKIKFHGLTLSDAQAEYISEYKEQGSLELFDRATLFL